MSGLKPQALAVLDALRGHPGGLTQMEALDLGLGDSLAQRVNELRAAGHAIPDRYEATPRGARVKRYFAPPEAPTGWGVPFAPPRLCPSCRLSHSPGTTCAPLALRTA